MKKKVHVLILMYDEEGSGEKGVIIGIFKRSQSYKELIDYVPSETEDGVKELFNGGYLWWENKVIH